MEVCYCRCLEFDDNIGVRTNKPWTSAHGWRNPMFRVHAFEGRTFLTLAVIYSSHFDTSLTCGAFESTMYNSFLIARSAIYVHRRSLLLVFSSFSPGFPRVIGLIIIGETVACTFRVIFSCKFKVPKNPWKNTLSSLLGSQATARLTPKFDTYLVTFFSFFKVPSPYLHKTVHFSRIWSFW